ncbi:MAG TPA: 4Fe-4S binding protein [Candidatus Atribacteria bacterium]|nr:4Fe-4S binding protein [Candidatus Atribacteria bacterium]
MLRRIIKIDNEKCNGCGLCVKACHEGAIGLIDGKARLLREDYCDGLGDCLPACPTGAITFEEREAAPYDEEAVKAHLRQRQAETGFAGGCPGSHAHVFNRGEAHEPCTANENIESELSQWPVQIKLAPLKAPYFDNANLLVAADCSAYAYGSFHRRFIRNHVTLIGCPKLDMVDYSEKLTEIIRNNNIKSVTIVRMSVPCCGGIEYAARMALQNSGKFIPWQVVTISPDGRIIE